MLTLPILVGTALSSDCAGEFATLLGHVARLLEHNMTRGQIGDALSVFGRGHPADRDGHFFILGICGGWFHACRRRPAALCQNALRRSHERDRRDQLQLSHEFRLGGPLLALLPIGAETAMFRSPLWRRRRVRRRTDRARFCRRNRRSLAHPPIQRYRRLSGPGSKALSVGRGRLRRRHLEMRRLAGAKPVVRTRRCHADPLQGQLKLKNWAFVIAQQSRMRKARVPLARRLAIIMHAMLRDRTEFASA